MLKNKNLSACAMVLAAGMSTRMRPLTDTMPKPLVPLRGIPLIDHVIGRLEQAGVETVVVNLHYHADRLEAHLKQRQKPRIVFSDERGKILDSGLGAKRMLPHIGDKPFLLANSDTVWRENAAPNVPRMLDAWDEHRMDILLLLASTATSIGYDGRGDFHCDASGLLSRRGTHETAPFAYAGFAVLKPELFKDTPEEPFSLNLLFDRAITAKRLYGLRLDGVWMHIGTPQALVQSENFLAQDA